MSQYSPPQASIQYQIRPPQPQFSLQAPSPNLDSLHRDIEDLIARSKGEFVRDMYNAELQTRLKALVDLQSVLRNQQLPPEALQAVRNQVRDLQMSQRPQVQAPTPLPFQNPVQNPMQPAFPGHPPIPYSTPVQAQYAPPPPPPPPPQIVHPQPTPEPAHSQPPTTATLASILASVQRNTQSQPNGPPPPPISIPTPQPPPPAQSGPAENPLLAQLRAAGLLNANANGNTNIASTPPAPSAQPTPVASQPVNLSDLLRRVVAKPSKQGNPDHVELTSASLKM